MANPNKIRKQKYWVDEKKRRRFPPSLFERVYLVKESAVDEFLKRNKRLPEHVHRTEEVEDGQGEE